MKEILDKISIQLKQIKKPENIVLLLAFEGAELFWNYLSYDSLVCALHQADALAFGVIFADPDRLVIILSDTDGEDISGVDIALKTQTNKIIKIKLQ